MADVLGWRCARVLGRRRADIQMLCRPDKRGRPAGLEGADVLIFIDRGDDALTVARLAKAPKPQT